MDDNQPPKKFTVTYCDKCGRTDLYLPLKRRHFTGGSFCVGGTLKSVTYNRDDETVRDARKGD